jgi:LysM repeat protein
VALALAAAVLFALPGLLGFGNPGAGASASPSIPVQTAIPSINPTPVPQATPQIYLVQSGDTMSRIAGRFGIPLNELIAANTQTVPDPNKLQIGQQIIIPAKNAVPPSEIPGAT